MSLVPKAYCIVKAYPIRPLDRICDTSVCAAVRGPVRLSSVSCLLVRGKGPLAGWLGKHQDKENIKKNIVCGVDGAEEPEG